MFSLFISFPYPITHYVPHIHACINSLRIGACESATTTYKKKKNHYKRLSFSRKKERILMMLIATSKQTNPKTPQMAT
jgi:hypothetical protein